jgi:hypothetical protein
MGGQGESAAASPGRLPRRATAAELCVVRDSLANPLASQIRNIRQSGLSRRTYQTALQRIRSRRWVLDRYLPSPVLTGLPYLTFLLARPPTGAEDRLVQEIRRNAKAVLIWSTVGAVLSVSFSNSPESGEALTGRLEATGLSASGETQSVTCPSDSVPVYFDFEGIWTRYGGLPGTVRYPLGLGGGSTGGNAANSTPSSRVLDSARSLVRRGAPQRPGGLAEPGLLGSWSTGLVDRSLVRNGWVEPRCFLDPRAVAASLTDFAAGITLVRGSLRRSVEIGPLAAELFERSRVHPFLLASDGHAVLIGFLSVGPLTQLAPAPGPRESVRATLERWLDALTVTRLRIDAVEAVVNHEYGNLLG